MWDVGWRRVLSRMILVLRRGGGTWNFHCGLKQRPQPAKCTSAQTAPEADIRTVRWQWHQPPPSVNNKKCWRAKGKTSLEMKITLQKTRPIQKLWYYLLRTLFKSKPNQMLLLKWAKLSSYPEHRAAWITLDALAEMKNNSSLQKISNSTTKPFHKRIPSHDHSPSLNSLRIGTRPISLSQ